MLKTLVLSLLLTGLLSCTTIRYGSDGRIPLYVSPKSDHLEGFVYRGRHRIYLFGNLPPRELIKLDEVVMNLGYESGANLKISEARSFTDWLITLSSFGLYSPLTFEVRGFGVRERDGDQFEGERRWVN